ncbi:hypothetical protein [Streptomyces sp. NPDC093261]|uniref:hypothetical protein n=1 Tax=Streptomyces sp. NPDC093261 TaxID=3366037 RepID=UPI0038213587
MQIEHARLHYHRLDRLAEVTGGVTLGPRIPSGSSVELPYLRVANVQDGYICTDDIKTLRVAKESVERFRVRPGDVLLTEGGDFDKLGRGAVWDGRIDPCLHQNHVFRVRCSEKLLPEFLALYLASPAGRSYFLRIAKQTTNLATISSSQLKAMPVPLVPLQQQWHAVGIATAVREVKRGVERSIEKLRSVRLGMVLGALASVDSVEPAIGWRRMPLREVVPFVEYGISEALSDDPQGTPVLRMNNIRDGKPDLKELRYCPVSVAERMMLRSGDVLFNRTNSIDHVGKAAIWKGELSSATFASYLVRLNPHAGKLHPEYLVEWLMHPMVRRRVKALSTAAVQQVNVNPARLLGISIDLPDALTEQRKIIAELSTCDRLISREEAELEKIGTLEQGIVADVLRS